MGGKSSKFVKKYEYHSHLQQIQQLLDELQKQQVTFANASREKNEKYEKIVSDLKSKLHTQVGFFHFLARMLTSVQRSW